MTILDKSITEIQYLLSEETNIQVFEDLLTAEKKGQKRKTMKRWLKERIKEIKRTAQAVRDFENAPQGQPKDTDVFPDPRRRIEPMTGIEQID